MKLPPKQAPLSTTHTPPGGQVTQVPPQLVCPEAQQTPLEQLPEQQSPFPLQVPPLAVQGVTQVPFWQTWPEARAFPQEPQLLASVCSLTHMPLQQFRPKGQSPAVPQVQEPPDARFS